jgi:hypothetical protein
MITGLVARSLDRGAIVFLVILAAIGILVPVLNLMMPVTSPFICHRISWRCSASTFALRCWRCRST